MPVTAHLSEDTFICPNCGDKNLKYIEVEDKDFQDRNHLSLVQASSIADEDLFAIHACTACGFKWIANEYIASTSQLSSFILLHFIEKLYNYNSKKYKEAVEWLKRATNKPLVHLADASLYTPAMANLEFFNELAKFIRTANVDDLVTSFNEISYMSIQGACDTNVPRHYDQPELKRSEGQSLSELSTPLKSSQVLADD